MTEDITAWLCWLRQLEDELRPGFAALDALEEVHTYAILAAFAEAGLGHHHFAASTGYGYDDAGRQALEIVYARVFGGEAALVRQQLSTGTQALSLCLQALTSPDQEVLFAGEPYDTLQTAVGLKGNSPGNLREKGVLVRVAPMPDEVVSWPETITAALGEKTRLIFLQRSRGYSARPSVPVAVIADLAARLRMLPHSPVLLVDNCYGEFVEDREPTHAGADLIAGSLIKNPGGGIAPSGAYVVGRKPLVDRVAAQLYAPGIEGDVGPNLLSPRLFFQGFFNAPHLVGQALRGAILCARAMTELGLEVSPAWDEPRADMVQRIVFDSASVLLAFCRAIQSASPVDAKAVPEPASLPGYEAPIVMAGGTFIQGSSSELTIDAPLRSPFAGYWQGGTSLAHIRLSLARGLAALRSRPPDRGHP